MIEIEFRAWDKTDKVMCEVIFIKFSKAQYTNICYRKVLNGKVVDANSLLDKNMSGTCVLMQYTGLKDKNGKKIFEGDILSAGATILKVEYSETETGFTAYGVRGNINTYCRCFSLFHLCNGYNQGREVEIIGNIYENPELIKGE